jgi:hypothetical protein
MSRTLVSAVIKTLAALTILLGIAMLYLLLGVAVPTTLHRGGFGNFLLVAIPMLVFIAYWIYLGYTLFSRHSERAFKHVWFGLTILTVVLVGRKLPSVDGYLAAIGIAIISLVARAFVGEHLFSHDESI